MGAFTDRGIKAMQPKGTYYRKYEGGSDPGFCVQVMPSGNKVFEQAYTVKVIDPATGAAKPKKRFLKLGTYPNTSLAEARIRARQARKLIEQGIDPQEKKAQEAHEARHKGTVDQLGDLYIAHLTAIGKVTASQIRRYLDHDVLPYIGSMEAKHVKASDIRDILYRLIQRDALVAANRLRSHLYSMFQWGIRHDNDPRSIGSPVLFGIDRNPVNDVPRNPDAERPRDRALSWSEIVQVWTDERIERRYRLAIQLLLITGQRTGEVTRAAWSEFDMDNRLWEIPAHRRRNRYALILPITDMMLEILEELKRVNVGSEWLFPAYDVPSKQKPMGTGSLPHNVQAYCMESGMKPWMPKDLRRTVKTRMGELGINKDIRDRIQGHSLRDISSLHYDRYDYVGEKRQALEAWCSHLEALISGANVRAINERKTK